MVGLEQRVGRRVADARRRAGLTQAALAERVEVATETISRLERGKTVPSLAKLEEISKALGIGLADLFRERHRDAAKERALDHLHAVVSPFSTKDVEAIGELAEQVLETWGRR